jgi:TRAP-type C4-dicarboxylate transport system substrate-binding protein
VLVEVAVRERLLDHREVEGVEARQVRGVLEAIVVGTAALDAKGYTVLSWAQIGMVSIFCTKPYATPEAAADAKFFAWDGDPAAVEAYKACGFRAVVLSSTDIVPSLQTGMISCVAQVPAYVLTARLFDKANFMIDYPWAYLIGASVVRKEAWMAEHPEAREEAEAWYNANRTNLNRPRPAGGLDIDGICWLRLSADYRTPVESAAVAAANRQRELAVAQKKVLCGRDSSQPFYAHREILEILRDNSRKAGEYARAGRSRTKQMA